MCGWLRNRKELCPNEGESVRVFGLSLDNNYCFSMDTPIILRRLLAGRLAVAIAARGPNPNAAFRAEANHFGFVLRSIAVVGSALFTYC